MTNLDVVNEVDPLKQWKGVPHLLSLHAADLQALGLTDAHLQTERDPHVPHVLRLSVKGQTLHAAQLFPVQYIYIIIILYKTYRQMRFYNQHTYSKHHSVGKGSLGLGGSAASFFRALLYAYC